MQCIYLIQWNITFSDAASTSFVLHLTTASLSILVAAVGVCLLITSALGAFIMR